MAHIHTAPGQHDYTVSAFIVRLDGNEPKLMLHMHKKLNKFLQFGGHIELNETPWQAIVHELTEESGYDIKQLKILQPKIRIESLSSARLHPIPLNYQTHQFGDQDHFHTDVAFAFITSQPPRSKIQDGESSDIRLFTLKELKTLNENQIPINVKETGIFVIQEILNSWQTVDTKNYN